jgi:uncharacterized membrane protein
MENVPLLTLLWAMAFGICPQRPSHSLFFGGVQMPIEARMGGIFAGFVLTAMTLGVMGRGRAWQMPDPKWTVLLVGLVALMGADGANAFLYDLGLPHLYTPTLAVRLATGLLTGIAAAAFVVPAFNSTVWRAGPNIAPLASPAHLLAVLVPSGLYLLAGLSGWPPLLYPLSAIAVFGVPALLGALGTVLFASFTGRANQATRWRTALPLVFGGLLLAGLLLGSFSGIRLALFGPGPMDLLPR